MERFRPFTLASTSWPMSFYGAETATVAAADSDSEFICDAKTNNNNFFIVYFYHVAVSHWFSSHVYVRFG